MQHGTVSLLLCNIMKLMKQHGFMTIETYLKTALWHQRGACNGLVMIFNISSNSFNCS